MASFFFNVINLNVYAHLSLQSSQSVTENTLFVNQLRSDVHFKQSFMLGRFYKLCYSAITVCLVLASKRNMDDERHEASRLVSSSGFERSQTLTSVWRCWIFGFERKRRLEFMLEIADVLSSRKKNVLSPLSISSSSSSSLVEMS